MPPKEILCPWCAKGTVLVEGSGEVRLSCCCRVCGRFFKVDAKTMTATRGNARKKSDPTGKAQKNRSSG